VFDAAMLLALQQFEKEGLIAALLLFRLVYFIIPFALALAIMGVRELLIGICARNHRPMPRRPLRSSRGARRRPADRRARPAAKIAQEVGMLLQDDDIHAGAREQEAEHHSGGPAAGDAAACVEIARCHDHAPRIL